VNRGYCRESPDRPAGVDLHQVRLPRDARWKLRHDRELLRGVTVLETEAAAMPATGPPNGLYRKAASGAGQHVALRLVPYYAWSNRSQSQMTVWIPLH